MTNESVDDMLEFHWIIDMLQPVDVGIVGLDREFKIKMWNGFMEKHRGKLTD